MIQRTVTSSKIAPSPPKKPDCTLHNQTHIAVRGNETLRSSLTQLSENSNSLSRLDPHQRGVPTERKKKVAIKL